MSDKRKKAAKAAKIHKDSMPCNKPRKDIQGGKKSVVKACEGGKEKSYVLAMQTWKSNEIIQNGVKF